MLGGAADNACLAQPVPVLDGAEVGNGSPENTVRASVKRHKCHRNGPLHLNSACTCKRLLDEFLIGFCVGFGTRNCALWAGKLMSLKSSCASKTPRNAFQGGIAGLGLQGTDLHPFPSITGPGGLPGMLSAALPAVTQISGQGICVGGHWWWQQSGPPAAPTSQGEPGSARPC